MTAAGDIITGGTGGAAQRLGIGALNQVLTVTGATTEGWAAVVNSVTAGTAIGVSGGTGAVTINNTGVTSAVAGSGISVSGATGAVTVTNTWGAYPLTTIGDIVYANAAATNTRLGIGTAGQVLTVVSGVPAWAAAGGGMSNPMTTTGDMIASNPGSTPVRIGIGAAGQTLSATTNPPSWVGHCELIASLSPSSGSSVSFLSIPQTFHHLWVMWTTGNVVSSVGNLTLTLNSVTTGYCHDYITVTGQAVSGVNSTSAQTSSIVGILQTSGVYNGHIFFKNYRNHMGWEFGCQSHPSLTASGQFTIGGGHNTSAAAITSITLTLPTSTFGSSAAILFSLYGLS
jgi:hypothetical protein